MGENNSDADVTGDAPCGVSRRAKRSFDRLQSVLLFSDVWMYNTEGYVSK
ncbi:hypothetical protein J4460_04400 [Candidatus Woesearchaeota archaeon]|nr:hypothetical protein [Candidatus Woesearchaeota archaeon]HIH37725.1 hypothetical protein [Candidatus Woesearchaeota archaeon]HIJ02678.1 hypothetical protein [Candidatus Woesearchaeota archaeon]